MTFKYSYEECLACENLKEQKYSETHFIGSCPHYRSIWLFLKTGWYKCAHYKPKGEVKMGKCLPQFTIDDFKTKKFRRKSWAEGVSRDISVNAISTNLLLEDLIADDWEIVPEKKKKLVCYVFINKETKDPLLSVCKNPIPGFELISTIEHEYEI